MDHNYLYPENSEDVLKVVKVEYHDHQYAAKESPKKKAQKVVQTTQKNGDNSTQIPELRYFSKVRIIEKPNITIAAQRKKHNITKELVIKLKSLTAQEIHDGDIVASNTDENNISKSTKDNNPPSNLYPKIRVINENVLKAKPINSDDRIKSGPSRFILPEVSATNSNVSNVNTNLLNLSNSTKGGPSVLYLTPVEVDATKLSKLKLPIPRVHKIALHAKEKASEQRPILKLMSVKEVAILKEALKKSKTKPKLTKLTSFDDVQIINDSVPIVDLTSDDVNTPKTPQKVYKSLKTDKAKIAQQTNRAENVQIILNNVVKLPQTIALEDKVEHLIETPKNNLIHFSSKQKKTCIVPECPGTVFFAVPFSMHLLLIWRFCLDNRALKMGDLVCDRHFIEEDIVQKPSEIQMGVLKEHSVPSIEPPISGCSIKTCVYKETPNMYAIPAWGKDFEVWLKYMNVTYKKRRELLKYRVCSKHFSKITKTNVFKLVPDQNLEPQKSLDVCASCDCEKKKDAGPFVKFPTDLERAKRWLEMCNREDILKKNSYDILCYCTDAEGVCFDHYQKIVEEELNLAKSKPVRKTNKLSSIDYNKTTDDDFVDLTAINNNIPSSSVITSSEKDTTTTVSTHNPNINYFPVREFCAFVNCATWRKNSTINKYKFTSNIKLIEIWKCAAGIPQEIKQCDLKDLFICEKHFVRNQKQVLVHYSQYSDENANDSNKLWIKKQDLVKLRFNQSLNPPAEIIVDLLGLDTINNSMRWFERCCVIHCKSHVKDVKMFKFPSNLDIYSLWVKTLRNRVNITKQDYEFYKNKQICINHFKQEDIINDALDFKAYPLLDLVDTTNEVPPKSGSIDKNIQWERICSKVPPMVGTIHGKAYLEEHKISLPYAGYEIVFGKDCPNHGPNMFPYNIKNLESAANININNIHPVQIHSAIIIDDDDETEKFTIEMIEKIFEKNDRIHGRFGRRKLERKLNA